MPDSPLSDSTVGALEWIGRGIAAVLVALGSAWGVLRGRRAKSKARLRPGVVPIEASRPARVLIVEDHGILRQSLRRYLQDSGFQVVGEAADREGGLALDAGTADVAVVDIKLDKGGTLAGLEVIRSLRAQSAQLVIIAMSGYEEHTGPAFKAGADEFFGKDRDLSGIVELLNRLVAQPR